MDQFRLFHQPDQGAFVDDTGVNNMEVTCRGPGMEGMHYSYHTGTGADFGNTIWSEPSTICPVGTAACQVAVKQDVANLGITDMQLKCCDY